MYVREEDSDSPHRSTMSSMTSSVDGGIGAHSPLAAAQPTTSSTVPTTPPANAASSSTSNSSPESSNRHYSPHFHSQSISSSKIHTPPSANDSPVLITSHVQQGVETMNLVDTNIAYNQLAYQRMLLSYSSMLAAATSASRSGQPIQPMPLASPSLNPSMREADGQLQYPQQLTLPITQAPLSTYSSVISSTATLHLPPSTPAFTVGPPPNFPVMPSPVSESSVAAAADLASADSNVSTYKSEASTSPPTSRKKKEASSRQMKSQEFDFDVDSDPAESTMKLQTNRHKKKQNRCAQVMRAPSASQPLRATSAASSRDSASSEAIAISFHDEHTSSVDVVEIELMPQTETVLAIGSSKDSAAGNPFSLPSFRRGNSVSSARGSSFAKHSRSTRHLTLDEVKSGQLRSVPLLNYTSVVQNTSEQHFEPSAADVVLSMKPSKHFAPNGIAATLPATPSHLSSFSTQCYYLALLIHQHTRGTMPEANALMMKHWFTAFLDAYLRGWGQVVFQNNPLTGLAIIIAMLINNQWIALMGIYATFVSTLFAKLLGLNPGAFQAGLFGYNAVLVGLGIATFDTSAMGEWNATILGPIGLMSMFSVIALVALGNVLGKFHVTPLTLPFNLSAIFYLVGAVAMNYFAVPFYSGSSGVKTVHLRVSEPLTIDWGQWLRAIPIGVGQVFLAGELSSGIICILGIAICSPWSALMSFLGSMVGQLAALGLGIDTALIYGDASTPAGLYGYNSVLGAIAIGGFFYLPNAKSTCMAIFCASMCAVLQACFKVLFTNWGGFPTLTFPFCITTLFFLLLHFSMPNMLIPIPLAILTHPEEHRHRYWIHNEFLEKVKHTAGFIEYLDKEDRESKTTTLEKNTASSAPQQSILAKKASFQAFRSTSKRALIHPVNKNDANPTESTESLYYKAELSRHYSIEEMEQRSTACHDFLNQFFDLLDPDGEASCITFQQLQASLNLVLGNTQVTSVISTQQMAMWMMVFENRELIALRQRKRGSKRNMMKLESDASSDSSSDEFEGKLADWNLFLSLNPSDIYIDYDDLFQLFMHYRPIDWKSQFLDTESDEELQLTLRGSLSSSVSLPRTDCGLAEAMELSNNTLLKTGNSVRFAEVSEEEVDLRTH